jgi:hypothetical protein
LGALRLVEGIPGALSPAFLQCFAGLKPCANPEEQRAKSKEQSKDKSKEQRQKQNAGVLRFAQNDKYFYYCLVVFTIAWWFLLLLGYFCCLVIFTVAWPFLSLLGRCLVMSSTGRSGL